MPNIEHSNRQRTLLDAARAEPTRRERRRLLIGAGCYATVFALSAAEIVFQSMSRRIVDRPEWWFSWVVFGCPGLVALGLAVSRYLVARSLGNLPGWSADALARLPPNVARLIGLPPPEVRRRGFALGGGVFAGGDVRAGTEMTTPEVLRSTSLRSRSAARNTTPQQQQQQGGGTVGMTPSRGTPSERRILFSPEESTGRMGGMTSLERSKAGRRALSIRPEDVGGMIKEYDERHARPAPPEGTTQASNALGYPSPGQVFNPTAMAPAGIRGYYGQGAADGGGWEAGGPSWTYQAYEPGETEVASARQGKDSDRDKAEQLLVRLGIAERTDEVTKNVKTYVVRLMRHYLEQFDEVCSLLRERGVAEEVLLQHVQRQPQLRIRNTPRAFVNLSLKDMASQFLNQPDFCVQRADGSVFRLFEQYQQLEEALLVTAGSGTVGLGSPAYVLERLRDLAEDDFMSAFVYDRGGGVRHPSNKDWSEALPTDAAIVMRLFVCCSDQLLPRQWEQDRPFARQHFVDRQPCNSDAIPGRFFLTRNDPVHPPHFFVVANQDVWHALPGPTNAFQAIALFLYAIKTQKSGYLGTGISIANIIQDIFGASDSSTRVY